MKSEGAMLTVQDMQALRALITSQRLTLSGAEAWAVAQLQQKLAATIQAAQQPKPARKAKKDTTGNASNGNSSRPAE